MKVEFRKIGKTNLFMSIIILIIIIMVLVRMRRKTGKTNLFEDQFHFCDDYGCNNVEINLARSGQ